MSEQHEQHEWDEYPEPLWDLWAIDAELLVLEYFKQADEAQECQ